METIRTYLENMFRNFPNTVEVRRAKEELYAMMEDKYNELKAEGKSENEVVGIVISEFGNIDEVAEGLDIHKITETKEEVEPTRIIKLQEAKEYITQTIKFSHKIALGVILCICSPIALIILSDMSEYNLYSITDASASLMGLLVLGVMIASAVCVFILFGLKYDKFEQYEKENFQLDITTESFVKQEKEAYLSKFAVGLTTGILVCILSIVPVIAASFLYPDTIYMSVSVGILLTLVSIGVAIIITKAMKHSTYEVLLQEGDYTRQYKISRKNNVSGVVGSIYWPLVVVVYLAWSFLSNDWGRTWIVWPIAGVLFAVIANLCNAIANRNAA